MKALTYILARLREPTTWAGITGLVSAVGISISPDLAKEIGVAGTAVVGVILTILKDTGAKE